MKIVEDIKNAKKVELGYDESLRFFDLRNNDNVSVWHFGSGWGNTHVMQKERSEISLGESSAIKNNTREYIIESKYKNYKVLVTTNVERDMCSIFKKIGNRIDRSKLMYEYVEMVEMETKEWKSRSDLLTHFFGQTGEDPVADSWRIPEGMTYEECFQVEKQRWDERKKYHAKVLADINEKYPEDQCGDFTQTKYNEYTAFIDGCLVILYHEK